MRNHKIVSKAECATAAIKIASISLTYPVSKLCLSGVNIDMKSYKEV